MFALDIPATLRFVCESGFSANALREGLKYLEFGRVRNANAVPQKDGITIRATVQGSARKPYAVEVSLRKNRRGKLFVEAWCSCPVGYNCKHAVAAIADVLGKRGTELLGIEPPPDAVERPEARRELAPAPLTMAAQTWIDALQNADTLPLQKKNICYVLETDSGNHGKVRILLAALRKNGQWGKPSATGSPDISAHSTLPAHDLEILRQLRAMDYYGYGTKVQDLKGSFGSAILQRMIATGRCYWQRAADERRLSAGPTRAGMLAWRDEPDGRQTATISLDPPAAILATSPPAYVDEMTMTCGIVQVEQPPALVDRWLKAPAVDPEQSGAFSKTLQSLRLPPPRDILIVERKNVRPTPVLRLMRVALNRPIYHYRDSVSSYGRPVEIQELALARLEIDYDGARIPYFSEKPSVEIIRDARVERIIRNAPRERHFYNFAAAAAGLMSACDVYSYEIPDKYHDDAALPDPAAWCQFIGGAVPNLEKAGWRVEIDSDFPFRLAQVQDWYSETATESGSDWFSIELGILVDGERVNLLPMIRTALEFIQKQGHEQPTPHVIDIRLPDGRFVALPARRILAIAQTLAELYDPSALEGDRLKVGRLRAAELTDIPGMGHWKGPDELKQLAQRIRAFEGMARVEPPPGLCATLRTYQLDGLSWLQFLREYNFGGILADDMGLGKTVQVLAHLQMEKESGRANLPSLVIAPTSLMANWRAEAQRFTPSLRVLVSHGGDRHEHFEKLAEYDLIVTSYSLLPRDEEILKKQPFHLLVLDEAQYVKNPNTRWADVARSLNAQHRLCMTGTPMENHLGELWSLMSFLSPGYLGTQRQFARAYRTPIEKGNDQERRRALAARLRPFIMRRKKEQVALDLPPKTEILRAVQLEGTQRDLYETIRVAMHERVRAEIAARGMDRSQIIILDALLKLRQVCCDPRLVKLDRARTVRNSAKLELLLDMLPKMIDEGRRVLLFSQFTSMLDLIQTQIEKRKIPFVRLTGETADRATPVRRFQAGDVPLFLISLKAGGTGLNLTAADTVIHYDPWWNPAVEQQATDRAHRIGQDKPVFVYKLVAEGTVEEKIVAMQEKKRELVAGLLGEGSQQGIRLSREELEHLFDPIG